MDNANSQDATRRQKGFIALYLALLALLVLSGAGASVFLLASSQQRVIENTKESLQAYYGAEAGVEDAFLRLKNFLLWSNPVTLGVLDANITTTITDMTEGKLVAAQGNDSSRVRKVEAVYRLSGATPQFFYGAHVGEGGLIMDNNSQVAGNVYSNGSVVGSPGAIVTDTITVAGSGGTLEDIEVRGDAFADECGEGSQIGGTLHANENNGCTFGAFETLGAPPDVVSLPISAEEIQQWKEEAEAGGVIGDFELDGSDTASLGPVKIDGNLELSNSAQLTLTGTLWVAGNVNVKNNAQVRLDSGYGISSGVLVADGVITLQDNSVAQGSGEAESYLMYLSTNAGSPALNVKNNAVADIVYTSAGEVTIENNTKLKEVTGYRVRAKNNAVVTFESGLQSATFTSGPGAAWEIVSWKEVQ